MSNQVTVGRGSGLQKLFLQFIQFSLALSHYFVHSLGYLILQIQYDMMCGLEQDVMLKYVAALTLELCTADGTLKSLERERTTLFK